MVGAAVLTKNIRRVRGGDTSMVSRGRSATFTIPAFRSRKHRGGKSTYLKDTYPSGFCPTKSFKIRQDSRIGTRHAALPLNDFSQNSLTSESKDCVRSQWGAPDGRRAIEVTRVMVGEKTVAEGSANELAQFGPEYWCSLSENCSPTELHPNGTPRQLSPAHMTIDGSAIRGTRFTSDGDCERSWPQRRRLSPAHTKKLRGHAIPGKGQRRRQARTPLESAAYRGPKPWASRAEGGSRWPFRPCTAGRDHSPFPSGTGVVMNTGPCEINNHLNIIEHECYEECDREIAIQENSTRQINYADVPGFEVGGKQPCDELRVCKDRSRDDEESEQADAPIAQVLLQSTKCLDTRDDEPGEAWESTGDCNSTDWRTGSACSLGSATTTGGWTAYRSHASDRATEHTVFRRSCSSLDSHRHGGSVSKGIKNILWSHLEVPNGDPDDTVACESDSHGVLPVEPVMMSVPTPAPSPPLHQLENLLATLPTPRGAAPAPPSHCPLPPVESCGGCYVRTRGDILLAVVKKDELLQCEDEIGLRALKAAALPARITAGATLAEGTRVIMGSGILPRDWAGESVNRNEGGDRNIADMGVMLEYFNSQSGLWKLIRSASDWRVFLQAPAGTHGAGVAFHSTGVPDRGADFLVAVTSARKVEGAVAWRTVRTKTSWPGFNTPKTRKETHDSTSRQDDRTTLRFALSESSESIRPWEATHQNRYDCRGGADWNRARKIQERCADAVREVQAPLLSLTNDNAATTLTASDLHNSVLHFSRRLASLVGGRRRQGPGPGAAVWTVGVVRGRETSDRPYRPKAAKLQRLAQHLEAGLKLRGQPGTGGLPSVPSQRIDMPYTRELAKWGYDEILGIPLTTVSSQK